MKIKQLVTKNYLQTQGMKSRFLSTEYKLEFSIELMSYIINDTTIVPMSNVLEAEIEPTKTKSKGSK